MAIFNRYPYTDFQQINLDWILEELKNLTDSWESYGGSVTAEAHASLTPEVTVTGDLKDTINFDFGLVKGNEGPQGPEGPEGPAGHGLEILDEYATLADLQTAHPTGSPGDAYMVGTGGSFTLYIWSTDNSAWVDAGALTSPAPSSSDPLMDGTKTPGTSIDYSRADHVHPSDTSKQDTLVNGTNIKQLDVSGSTYNIMGSGSISVQEPLVSGTNICTINGNSLLGSSDILVQDVLVSGTDIKTVNGNDLLGSGDVTVQATLVSGTNIKTINSNSILGSGDLTIAEGITSTIIWENSAPGSAFTAQTITESTTGYRYFLFMYRLATSSSTYVTTLMYKNGYSHMCFGLYPDGSDVFKRAATVKTDATGFTFNSGYSNTTQDNTKMIPFRVYAFK